MDPDKKLEELLGMVGLLRAKFSMIMRAIHETREEHKKRFSHPPEELGYFMAHAQELFTELLKASEFLTTARDNLDQKRPEVFEDYLDNWVRTQTTERFEKIEHYLIELSQVNIQGFYLDPEVWQEGLSLIHQVKKPS